MSRPISSCLRSSVWRRRMRSIARCFAVPISQAPGLSGTPEFGHCSSAATKASCASSSAVPMSPTTRVSPAMRRADSIRQIASIARWATPVRGSTARAPSHAFAHCDLADLEGPSVVRRPLEPLERFVERAHLPQPVAGHELFGLRERPIDDGPLLPLESDALSLRARREPPGTDDHAGFDELLVELLVRRH